jgi:ubiquinone biosynthesis accessory factor UbiJ
MKMVGKNFFIKVLQKGLNRYLALDPESSRRIKALAGKIVTVKLLQTGLVFHLTFTEHQIQLHLGEGPPADTVIEGTPLRLLHLALSRQNRQQFFSDDVSIQGNLELGQLVIDLFDHLEIDWEEMMANVIGDVSSHHVSRIFSKIKSVVKHSKDILVQDFSEYIQEEVGFFPPREALQDFFQDVDALRMDTDRIEAKIKQLQKLAASKRSAQ